MDSSCGASYAILRERNVAYQSPDPESLSVTLWSGDLQGLLQGGAPNRPRLLRCLLLTAAVLTLVIVARPASAHTPLTPSSNAIPTVVVNDPFEKVNRRFYIINRGIDRAILRPAALGYEKITPGPLRRGLHHLIANLGEPLVFLNDLLQLKIAKAAKTVVRFATNSTVGLGGLVDAATSAGFEHHDNDFGTTLARYGIPSGPYVFLPLLGPSTVRDLIGSGVDMAANPLKVPKFEGLRAVKTTSIVLGGLDQRASAETDLEAIDSMGTDTYATMRSLYLQNRLAEINGAPVTVDTLPSFDDPGAPTPVAIAQAPATVVSPVEATPAVAEMPPGPVAATSPSTPPISLVMTGPITH